MTSRPVRAGGWWSLRPLAARIAAVALCLTAAMPALAADADVAGSRDPAGVERYPRSSIESYTRDEQAEPRDFIMSRVDRIRRDLRVDDQLRLPASLESATYHVPDGTAVDDVVAHYRSELGGDVLFSCEGRGCGRSADWANQVFGESVLYGPDRNQRYLALEWQDQLVALYVIERGNQRVYAHVRVLDPAGAAGVEPNVLLVRRLAERGWAVVEGVQPQPDGQLGDAARAVLAGLDARLTDLPTDTVWVVCHLYAGDDAAQTLEHSRRCAESAARIISAPGESAEGGGAAPGVSTGGRRYLPFGGGALLPRSVPPRARVELIAPQILRREP